MNLEGYEGTCQLDEQADRSIADKWILSRLNNTTREVNQALEDFKFNDAALTVYKFIWNEYCDWYIELAKSRLAVEGSEKKAAQNVLLHVLEASLKLLHPFMPFITEEIWQKLPKNGDSIMVSDFPKFRVDGSDAKVEEAMGKVMEVITGVRNIRGEMNLNPGLKLNALIKTGHADLEATLKKHAGFIRELARVDQITIGPDIVKTEVSASSVLGEMDLIIPLEGMMDFEEEKRRIEKELKKIAKDLIFLDKKLSNPNFVKKAPAEVIEKDEKRKTALSKKQAKLDIHLQTIEQAIR